MVMVAKPITIRSKLIGVYLKRYQVQKEKSRQVMGPIRKYYKQDINIRGNQSEFYLIIISN